MAKRREMNKQKRNTIESLIEMYDIQSAEDIQDALRIY